MSDRASIALDPLMPEAIAWVVRLGSGAATANDLAACADWRARSPSHDAAWHDAAALGSVLREVGREVIDDRRESPAIVVPFRRSPEIGRRALLTGTLAASAIAVVAVGHSLDLFPAIGGRAPDFATKIGERRTIHLAQGLTLDLDAQTSIAVDQAHDRHHLELLAGRADVSARLADGEVVLASGNGRATARTARFEVKRDGERTCVTCLQGDIRVDHGDRHLPLVAAQQVAYTQDSIGRPTMIDAAEVSAWQQGQLVFHHVPLSEVIRDVNRYRPGRIVIANADVGRRPVNGIFHVRDIDAAIIQVQQITGARATRLPGGIVVLS